MLKKSLFLIVSLGVLLLSSLGSASEQYGILSGNVVDDRGVVLPGVEVTVEGPAMMGTRTTMTNSKGFFRIPRMNVGAAYTATFKLKGFKTLVRKDIGIGLGKESFIKVIMKAGEITDQVVVTGEIPIIDPGSSANSVNISGEIVENLATDRQYQTIMEMTPGAIPAGDPAMMGASAADNIYRLDGMESADPLTKTWSTAMNFDNFEEMQVIAQGAPAEYGRGTGAVINVVTKSGGNRLHGTARLSVSKVKWNAEPKEFNTNFSAPTRYLNETRPAINLGGPIIKDHIWFFASWERRNMWKTAAWYRNPTEALNHTPGGEGRGYYKGYYASAKLTMQSGKFSLMGMWNEDPITIPDYYKYINSPGFVEANEAKKTEGGWNVNGEATAALGTDTYITARFSMKRNHIDIQSDVQEGPMYRQGDFYWGAGYYDYKSNQDHNQYAISMNHFMDTGFGYHDLKLGFEYYDINILDPVNYSFPGGEFIMYSPTGIPMWRWVYETDVPKQAAKYTDTGTLFLQDKWEVMKGLTLNLGLRFEGGSWKNHAGEKIINWNLTDMFAPRLGAVYSFGKHKFHANWGRYYDLYAFHLVDLYQPNEFSRHCDQYIGEYYGYPTWTIFEIYTFVPFPTGGVTRDDHLKPQYMDELGIGYQAVLSPKLSAGISYMHREWRQKIEDYILNDYGIWGYDVHIANETDYKDQYESWGKTFRKYDGVLVTLKKNLGEDRFQFLASYTWSRLRGFDNTDSESTWGNDPYQYINALGYLPNDVRHQVRFYGSFILPFDLNVGINFYWFSGYPYTDYVDMLYEGDIASFGGSYFNYLLDKRGESGRYPAEWRLDLRVEKKFRIKRLFSVSLYADLFNLLNQQNETGRDNYLGEAQLTGPVRSNDYIITWHNPGYGKFTAWYAPMSFFLGAKIEW
jgi:hypothetical protein